MGITWGELGLGVARGQRECEATEDIRQWNAENAAQVLMFQNSITNEGCHF